MVGTRFKIMLLINSPSILFACLDAIRWGWLGLGSVEGSVRRWMLVVFGFVTVKAVWDAAVCGDGAGGCAVDAYAGLGGLGGGEVGRGTVEMLARRFLGGILLSPHLVSHFDNWHFLQ